MRRWFINAIPFVALSLVLLAVLGWWLLTWDKAELHLWMNSCHNAAGDFFFRYYTYVGEWVPYVVVFGLLFYKAGWATFLLTDVVVSGLIAQRLKYVFDTDRPYKFFEKFYPDVQLPFVDGVTLSKWYSCPSGHTTTFFAMFFVLALMACDKKDRRAWPWSALFFLMAVLGAYSRIYLSQHFAEDIFAGVILGVVTTLLLLFAVPKLEKTAFWNWNFKKMHLK